MFLAVPVFVVGGTNAQPAAALTAPPIVRILAPVSLQAVTAAANAIAPAELTLLGMAGGGGGGFIAVGGGGGGGAAAGGAAIAGAAAGGVAIAPVVIVAGAVVGLTAGAVAAWKWRNGQCGTACDPAPPQNGYAGPTGEQVTSFVPCNGICGVRANFTGPTMTSARYLHMITFGYDGAGACIAGGPPPNCTSNRSSAGSGVALSAYANGAAGFIQVGSGYTAHSAAQSEILVFSCPSTTFCFTSSTRTLHANSALIATHNPKGGIVVVGGTPTYGPAATPGTTPVTVAPVRHCSGGTNVAGTPFSVTGSQTVLPQITMPNACPAGQTTIDVEFPTTFPDGSPGPVILPKISAPIVPSHFPDCQPLGTCQLTLTRIHPATTLVESCNNSGLCIDWQLQPQTGPLLNVTTVTTGVATTERARQYPDSSHLECRFGAYLVPTDECTVIPTEPGPTGLATPLPEVDVEDHCDFKVRKPWTWPLTALKCAFVPRQTVINAELEPLTQAWAGSAPGAVTGAVGTVFTPITALLDVDETEVPCEGPGVGPLDLPMATFPEFHPFTACPVVVAMVLDVVRPLESAMMYLTTFLLCCRTLSRTIGHDGALPAEQVTA